MQIKGKFLRNNFSALIFGLDFFYVIIFFIFYVMKLELNLSLNSVIKSIFENYALVLVLVHPFFFMVIFILNSRTNKVYEENLLKSIDDNNNKIEQVYEFVEQLRAGETTNLRFNELFQQDKLIRSLLNLRDELDKSRKEEEIRKKEEQQRHWTNEGLAKFGAILRENVEDLDKLSNQITSNLTKYLNSQQAGFFIIKEDEGKKYFDMISLFAFERKKFPDKKVQWGEGLIGACAIEQKSIFITDTTNSFVDITSGLGKSNPRSVLIVPIKDNEGTIHGVLEIASFKVFEDYEINFVEQVAESIGLTMATIKTSIRTQELLKDSQKQAEMMAQQEETMRKNIEEIETVRNQTEKELRELATFSEAVDQSILHIDVNTDGKIFFANENILNTLNYTKDDLIDKDFTILLPQSDKEKFTLMWKEMIEEHKKQVLEQKLIDAQGKTIWIVSSFFPVISEENEIEKISLLAVNFSEKQNIINQNIQKINAHSQLLYSATFDLEGKTKYISDNLQSKIIAPNSDITEFTVFNLFENDEQFNVIWANIIKGRKYQSEKSFKSINEEIFTLNFTLTPLLDINNNVIEIDFIAYDLSEQEQLKTINEQLNKEFQKLTKKLEQTNVEAEKLITKAKLETKKELDSKIDNLTLYKYLFENISEAVVLTKNNTIVLFNKNSEQLWGYNNNIVLGKKLKYLFPLNDEIKKSDNYLLNILETEKDVENAFIVDKDMKEINVKYSVQKFKADREEFLAIILSR